jgi:predicted transposase/invertase (TIGR01784 family)
MRRDSIFYKLFQQSPALLFDLLGQPPANAALYRFDSVAVKEPTFTIDGVFLPPESAGAGVVYFCEVQFQKVQTLYERLLGESALYFYQNRDRFSDWQMVVIYPSRSVEQDDVYPHRAWINSDQLHRIYLDELGDIEQLPLGVGLMVLTIQSEAETTGVARALLQRTRESGVAETVRRGIIEMINTILIYKFTNLSREEIEGMLDLSLGEPRVFEELRQEGRQEGEAALVLRLLKRRFNQITAAQATQVSRLSIEQLEALGEALLDFREGAELARWLEANPVQEPEADRD